VAINASTTGYPAGIALTPFSGKLTSDHTYVGVSINAGSLGGNVLASNVTLRNCLINGDVIFAGNNVTVDHCTITGGVSLSGGDNFTFTGNNLYNWSDALHITSDSGPVNKVTVTKNWMHSPHPNCADHSDGMQLLGVNGITITDNIIDLGSWITCGSNPDDGPLNGAFQVENTQGNDLNGIIDHNYLNGGGYTARFYQCSAFTFTSNSFGTGAHWGLISVPASNLGCFTNWSGNLSAAGKPVNLVAS